MVGPTRAGIELHEQQPRIAASYRQAGRQSLSRSELAGRATWHAALHSGKVRAGREARRSRLERR